MVYGVNKTGTTAAKFLSIEVGSNAVGMGGMYIYHVDAPNIGEKIGKLAIVK